MACAAVLFCVSFENTPLEPYRVTSTGQSEAASSAPAASALSEEKVNINTASKEELIGLNGIGEVLADRIIEYREANSGYKDVRELTNGKGLGEKLRERRLPYGGVSTLKAYGPENGAYAFCYTFLLTSKRPYGRPFCLF